MASRHEAFELRAELRPSQDDDCPGDRALIAYAITDVGEIRSGNEDACCMAPLAESTTAMLAVADGCGGMLAGEVASVSALRFLVSSLGRMLVDADRASSLERAFDSSNRGVMEQANSRPEYQGMATTLTAALVDGDCAYVGQVGDSRAYLIRAGKIVQLTQDQSYVELLVRLGHLTREEAKNSPYSNVILQAIGPREALAIGLTQVALRRGDRLLLCSDGLSNKVADDELLAIGDRHRELRTICEHLVDLACERGGEDNITVVLAEMVGEGFPEPSPDDALDGSIVDLRPDTFDAFAGSARSTLAPDRRSKK